MKTLLMLGCPNVGKTALFNFLSGENRKVANYTGITVETGFAELESNEFYDEKIRIVDLPGIYGLMPSSLDEGVTVGTLLGKNSEIPNYDAVAMVIDKSRLDAGLALAQTLRELFGQKLMVIINKNDIETKYSEIDWKKYSELTGLRVHTVSTFRDDPKNLDTFIRLNMKELGSPVFNHDIELTEKTIHNIPFDLGDKRGIKIVASEDAIIHHMQEHHQEAREIRKQVAKEGAQTRVSFTYKVDQWLLHPLIGSLVFISVFYLVFHAIYTWSGPLMDGIDSYIALLGDWVGTTLPDGDLKSFIVDGVIAGVGGIVVFLPQIMILFGLLSILEQSGYIARAAMMADRLMYSFGLNGKAFLPFLSGFACSVPAIMSTRTIADKRERMATLMVLPLITCSARLPVYVLLIGTFIPKKTVLGFLDSQALSFFFLYFIGTFVALVMAKIFRLTVFKGSSSSFIIELPLYQRPSLKVAFKAMKDKAFIFLKKAGTIILWLSMLVWFMSTYPKIEPSLLDGKTEQESVAISLEHSMMGQVGKAIEPLIAPLGYDWKIGVGILIAFGARELFVSALGTIYALGDVDDQSASLRERLVAEISPVTGAPVYNFAVAWSLLIFFAFACQCMSTLAIIKREAEGTKYAVAIFLYMGILAYLGAFATYRLLL